MNGLVGYTTRKMPFSVIVELLSLTGQIGKMVGAYNKISQRDQKFFFWRANKNRYIKTQTIDTTCYIDSVCPFL